jgi:hypothetical protein
MWSARECQEVAHGWLHSDAIRIQETTYMNTPNTRQPDSTNASSLDANGDARRKLIRASLATGPIIATLTSPSVFATECVAPSQTLSAARSHAANQLGNCKPADSCDTWKGRLDKDPCASSQHTLWRDTKFHSVFVQQSGKPGCSQIKIVSGVATLRTFREVLVDTSANNTVARQFVGAYLNVCNGVLFPVGGFQNDQARCAQSLVDMWNEWATKGSYTPYAGASAWDQTKVSHYLTYFVPKA